MPKWEKSFNGEEALITKASFEKFHYLFMNFEKDNSHRTSLWVIFMEI